jgi:hypothetical protein
VPEDLQVSTRAGLAIVTLLIVAIVVSALEGCAGTFKGVCIARPIGQTDGGLTAVQVYCEPDES